MSVRCLLALCLVSLVAPVQVVRAQTTLEAGRVVLATPSDERLRDDLKFLIDLAPQNLRKQWKTLDEFVAVFEDGVDLKRPLRLDVVFTSSEMKYVVAVPVSNLNNGKKNFVKGLTEFGWLVKADAHGLYTIANKPPRAAKVAPPPSPSWFMRAANNWVQISPDLADVPPNFPNPANSIAPIIKPPIDLALRVENDGKDLPKRTGAFKELRKQLEAAIKFKRGESDADFEIRKLSAAQSFNEAERFLVQSQLLDVNWTTDTTKPVGIGNLSLTALPGTSLEESVTLLAAKPSFFANVPFAEKFTLQSRWNFAIDPMRSEHARELYPALLQVLSNSVDARPNLKEPEKAAAKAALEKLFGMLAESIPLKVLDAFIDVHPSGDGKNTLLAGVRCANGRQALACIEQFPKIRSTWKLEKNVGEHSGVDFHKLTVAEHRRPVFSALCGGEPFLLIGTGKEVVWAAAGKDAESELKAAIDKTLQPPPEKVDAVVVHLDAKFGPLVEVWDKFITTQPVVADPSDKQAKKDEQRRAQLRKYATDAFAGGLDTISVRLSREGNTVTGLLEVRPGVLRYLGTMIADSVAEYLQ